MMGADLGSDIYSPLLTPTNQLDGAARAHVAEVYVTTRPPSEQDVTNHHYLLCLVRYPFEAKSSADDALIHGAADCECRLLAVVGDGNSKAARVLERRTHEVRARDRFAVVAHGDGSRADHLTELRENLTALAKRDGPDRIDPRRAGACRLTNDESDRRLIVGDGIGVRHRAHRGESASSGGTRSRRDRFHVLAPRLAQVAMHVDQPGRNDQSRAVERLDVVARSDIDARP